MPEIVTAAATAMITEKSPYIVRTSFTLPQASAPMADWALKNGIKKVVTIVTDYGPGIDAEKWFSDTFEKGGGKIAQKIRVPLKNPDFSPFLQRHGRRQARRGVRLRALGLRRHLHERVRRARARQVGHQADRHRRRHR